MCVFCDAQDDGMLRAALSDLLRHAAILVTVINDRVHSDAIGGKVTTHALHALLGSGWIRSFLLRTARAELFA
jgi:hypothetical protein